MTSSFPSDEERKLFVEIALHLSHIIFDHPAYRARRDGGWFDIPPVREWHSSCDYLAGLGFLEIETHGARFLVERSDLRGHLEALDKPDWQRPEQAIENLLRLDEYYHGDISDRRQPFRVPGYLEKVMWALVACGFAIREPDGFQWTDKVAPIFIDLGLWSPDGVPFLDLDAASVAPLTDRIWDALPLWRRHWLAVRFGHRNPNDLYHYMRPRWTGDRLALFPKGTQKRGRDWVVVPPEMMDTVADIADRLKDLRRWHPL